MLIEKGRVCGLDGSQKSWEIKKVIESIDATGYGGKEPIQLGLVLLANGDEVIALGDYSGIWMMPDPKYYPDEFMAWAGIMDEPLESLREMVIKLPEEYDLLIEMLQDGIDLLLGVRDV